MRPIFRTGHFGLPFPSPPHPSDPARSLSRCAAASMRVYFLFPISLSHSHSLSLSRAFPVSRSVFPRFLLFSLRVSPRCTPAVTGRQFARKLQLKNIALRAPLSIVDPDGNRVPAGIAEREREREREIAAFNSCVSKIEEGWEQSGGGGGQDLKGGTGG
jgi:hypothetical protein